tara:strand:+ start:507 stop:2327 length:1821 start_codon:yes stop_codon:yes gene_type:complete
MPRTLRLTALAAAFSWLVVGCTTQPTNLDDLPRTPRASVDQLLKDAKNEVGPQAELMRLYAAQTAMQTNDPERTKRILEQIPQSKLPTDQQIRFSELQAQSALALGDKNGALRAIQHPSLQQIDSRPLEEQLRIQQLRADIYDANDRPVEGARERVFINSLLAAEAQTENQQAIWDSLNGARTTQLQAAAKDTTGEFAGWVQLALINRQNNNLGMQIQALQAWREAYANHPANQNLPKAIAQIQELKANRPTHIGLLLPFSGPLAGVAQALKDGFLAAQFQAQTQGIEQPEVTLYDSTQYADPLQALNQAKSEGVQWVIGPLEKDKVAYLASQANLPLPVLSLNYSEQPSTEGLDLFQFGLAPEDEARSAATRAWDDGFRRMATLSTNDDWSQRANNAFKQQWEAMGGEIIGQEIVDQPATVANQMGELLKIRQSERRASSIQRLLRYVKALPTPRQDLDALFLAATPLQARQIKPTLAFQYAASLPVYATSHSYTVDPSGSQNTDLDGLLVAETPWLLEHDDPLYQGVTSNWPQAAGPLGRIYAMGIDAQRVFNRLPQMRQYPETRIDGATGLLSLTQDGRIQRDLAWGQIQDGLLQPAVVERDF